MYEKLQCKNSKKSIMFINNNNICCYMLQSMHVSRYYPILSRLSTIIRIRIKLNLYKLSFSLKYL